MYFWGFLKLLPMEIEENRNYLRIISRCWFFFLEKITKMVMGTHVPNELKNNTH